MLCTLTLIWEFLSKQVANNDFKSLKVKSPRQEILSSPNKQSMCLNSSFNTIPQTPALRFDVLQRLEGKVEIMRRRLDK